LKAVFNKLSHDLAPKTSEFEPACFSIGDFFSEMPWFAAHEINKEPAVPAYHLCLEFRGL
jgi:hypothetical protein